MSVMRIGAPIATSLGRSNVVATSLNANIAKPTGPQDVCALAASAAARKSVAAPGLARQCAVLRAQQPQFLTQGPTQMPQPEDEGGIPRPVLIVGGGVAVLGLGFLLIKLLK